MALIGQGHLCWPFSSSVQRYCIYRCTDELNGQHNRMRSAEAIAKHWCLVFVAYSFLHLACLPPPLAQGTTPVRTSGEVCRQQAVALLQKLLLYTHVCLLT